MAGLCRAGNAAGASGRGGRREGPRLPPLGQFSSTFSRRAFSPAQEDAGGGGRGGAGSWDGPNVVLRKETRGLEVQGTRGSRDQRAPAIGKSEGGARPRHPLLVPPVHPNGGSDGLPGPSRRTRGSSCAARVIRRDRERTGEWNTPPRSPVSLLGRPEAGRGLVPGSHPLRLAPGAQPRAPGLAETLAGREGGREASFRGGGGPEPPSCHGCRGLRPGWTGYLGYPPWVPGRPWGTGVTPWGCPFRFTPRIGAMSPSPRGVPPTPGLQAVDVPPRP